MLVKARELLLQDERSVWSLDEGNNQKVDVEFDDGIVQTTARHLIGSWMCWIFHRKYPELPLTKSHLLGGASKSIRQSNDTLLSLLTRGYQDVFHNVTPRPNVDEMNDYVARSINEINNSLCVKLETYVTSCSMRDVVDILDDPIISKINREIKPTEESIANAYKLAYERFMDPDALVGNPIVEYVKAGLVSKGQVLQCFIARGFLTDYNSEIFTTPVLANYAEGISKLYDFLIDSRSATKAQTFTKKPLEDSEWFNRKMQLLAATIKNVYPDQDCGTDITIPIMVRSVGWFKFMLGKYHVEDGKLKIISISDRDRLVGKVINLRTPMFCKHKDRDGICGVCYGQLAHSIPRGAILGHISATSIGEKLSQKMLSTKHLDTSSTAKPFVIDAIDRPYIAVGSNKNALRLRNEIWEGSPDEQITSVKLQFESDKAGLLSDITVVDEIDDSFNPTGLTGFKFIDLVRTKVSAETGSYDESIPLTVSAGARKGVLSSDLMQYIKNVGWRKNETGMLEVDITEMPRNIDIVNLPLVHESMTDYQKEIEGYLTYSSDVQRASRWLNRKITPNDAGDILEEFFGLINQRLNVNIVHCEVMLYLTMCRNPKKGDYFLPRGHEEREVCDYKLLLKARSLSAMLIYQEQAKVLTQPGTFLVDKHQDHAADYLFY